MYQFFPRMTLAVLLLTVSTILMAGGTGEPEDRTENASSPQSASRGTTDGLPNQPPVPRSQLPAEFLDQSPPGRAPEEFTTDFSRATISYADILSGGPPKGGIPALDRPRFVSIQEAETWIDAREPVLVVEAAVAARAIERRGGSDTPAIQEPDDPSAVHVYPLQILTWHEIVNDTVGGVPVAVTFCPLCNTGIAFSRRLAGSTLSFNTTGRLRFSNLIMFDRETESWWQQASGEGLAGFFAGTRLTMVPVLMLPFGDVAQQWPEARVLPQNTGFDRAYGTNPYVGYDSSDRPFLLRGAPALGAEGSGESQLLDRVVSIELNGETSSVPYSVLQRERLVATEVNGQEIVVLWEAGTASALDTPQIRDGADVGSANAFFARTLEGRSVMLTAQGGAIVDSDTGSRWNAAGLSVAGPLEGHRLEPAPGVQHFWFSHAALVAR